MVVERSRAADLSQSYLDKGERYIAPANSRYFNIVAERGEGSYLWDVNQERYLDFAQGIAVNNVGHCHPKVVEATRKQIGKLIHCSAVTHHTLNVALAEKLAQISPGDLDCVFLNNSGGEAVDAAIKMARFVTGRPNVIAFNGGFHGRTLLATTLTTAKAHYREGYEPLPSGIFFMDHPYCFRCPINKSPSSCALDCFDLFEQMFHRVVKPNSVAAIILEPVQGEGGVVAPASSYPDGSAYMRRLREICDQHGILLIFDEVQTGFGRTGLWFASENFGVVPDVQIMAKGIASGFPMAGIIAPEKLMKKWSAGRHGSTFGGNLISCAAAIASIGVIEEDKLLENAQKMGFVIMKRLQELKQRHSFIGDIRGLGLMIGIEIVDLAGRPDGIRLRHFLHACLERKLLLLDCGDHDHVARLTPALNISLDQTEEALRIIEESLQAVSSETNA